MDSIQITLIAALPLFFVTIWCVVLLLISTFSGWSTLAHRYFSPRPFTGTIYPFQSARMKQARFMGALNMGADRTGLYLAPMLIFRPFHKPLLIPWSEINARPLVNDVLAGCQITFSAFPGVTLALHGQVLHDMVRHLKL
jgi:hypothetical protein